MQKTPHILAILFFLLVSLCNDSWSGEGAIAIGRPLKARPWLADLTHIPTAVVPYSSLPVSQVVPQTAVTYSIDPNVTVAAYSYIFHVKGIDAEYEVISVASLVKLVHELAVIEELKHRHKGKEFASGVADGVKGIGTGIANLFTKPGESFKSMGERLRQTGRSIERVVGTEEKVGKDESGHDRSLLGSGPAGMARRALAYETGVDVYTSNPVLQKLLTDLSHVYTAGSFATWAIPYNIGLLNYFNPISGDDLTERHIRDYEPYELRRLVGEELQPILRMNREDSYQPLNRWLMNPNYSPRNTAYIGQALIQLKNATNLNLVMQELAEVRAPEEADMLTLELRLYSLLDKNIQKIVAFEKYRALFVGLGENNVMYILFPGDTLRPWDETKNAFAELYAEAVNYRLGGIEVWSIGDVHPALVQGAEGSGVVIHQNILRNEAFYRPQTPTVPVALPGE